MTHDLAVVLFDLGGVLVELAGVPTMLRWLENQLDADQVWAEWLTSPVVRQFETGKIGPEAFADQLIQSMALPVDRASFLAAFVEWPRRVYPKALDLVGRVPRRYVRATLCNTNVLHWPRLMNEMGLAHVFDRHFASHLIGKLKPDPDVFEHVMAELNCEPSHVLFLDDNRLNVEGARRVGMHAARVCGVEEAARVLKEYGVLD